MNEREHAEPAPESTASDAADRERDRQARSKGSAYVGLFDGATVLIVDDDFRNIFALTALLERGGLTVVAAQSGPAALTILEERNGIDVVLMDIMMPVMNGYETMAAIRAIPRMSDLPIIAVTGKVVGGERERCIAAGASDYIPKPVDTAELLSALTRWYPTGTPRRHGPGCVMTDGAGARDGPPARAATAILVVDDNAAKRLSIQAILGPLHEIVEVGSGEEALHAVMSRTFAVILMDIQLPDMDGYETARLIRMRRESRVHPDHLHQRRQRRRRGGPDRLRQRGGRLHRRHDRAGRAAREGLDLRRAAQEVARARTIARRGHVAQRALPRQRGPLPRGPAQRRRRDRDAVDDGLIESFNRAATRLFGFGEDEAIGRPFVAMLSPAGPAGGARGQQSATGRRKDGSTFPVEQSLSHVQLGTRTVHICCVRDISEREAYTDALQHQALHDPLTGLPNRVLFRERLSHAIRRSSAVNHSLAMLLVDLDDFKRVNDTLGHQNGDMLLRLVAGRIVGCLREGDTIARLGGDEFAILPLSPTELAGAATVAWKVQRAFEAPFVVGEHSVELHASIGMALAPEHGDNIDDLMRRADLAMYDAKRKQSGCAVFAKEQERAPARRLALLGNLRRCVERDELVLHYQPKVDLATGETIGLEALIRWNHPSGRLFGPDEFMPVVEGDELMITITKWVINEAMRKLRVLRDQGFDLTMAVNLGARCLAQDAGILETVEDMTTAWGIPPDKLTFELTESALIDTTLPELLTRLKSLEQHLSIDDFGTGYSSLVYIQRLPVVEIKADRSFVMTMASVKSDAVIVRSIIELAHNLSIKVVAEGVEDEATLAMLVDYGCDEAQGFHIARPMPGPDVAAWLDTSLFGLRRRLPHAAPLRLAPAVDAA